MKMANERFVMANKKFVMVSERFVMAKAPMKGLWKEGPRTTSQPTMKTRMPSGRRNLLMAMIQIQAMP